MCKQPMAPIVGAFLTLASLLTLDQLVLGNTPFAQELTHQSARDEEVSREDIKKRFKRIADTQLERDHARLTREATHLLDDTIAGASARIFTDRNGKERLSEAEDNFRKLLGELVKHGSKSNDGGVVIEEKTFRAAWNLCPIFPFC